MTHPGVGLALVAALSAAPGARGIAQEPGGLQVAILPFKPAGKPDPAIARAAEHGATRLVERLGAAGVRAAVVPDATLESLRKQRRARFAVEQILEHDRGKFSAELRLMEVASGDELRSYMYGWGDEAGVAGLADAAAPRIAAAVREAGD